MSDSFSQHNPPGQSGKAAIFAVLGVLIVAAVAGLAFLSGKASEDPASVSSTMPASGDSQQAATDQTDVAKTAQAGEQGKPSQEIREGNPTIAKVDGQDIKRLDLLNFMQQLPPQLRNAPIQQLYPQLIEQVVNARLVDDRAAKTDLANDPAYKQQVELARQQILRNLFVERELSKMVTDDKIKAAYDDLMKKQKDVEEVKASHILVKDEAKAKEVVAKLESGAKFADLAKEYSSDPSGQKGGDLGWFAKTEMVPEFADAAFKLKKGDYTREPVKSQFGWHVISLEDRRMRPNPKLEDVKPFLEQRVRGEIFEKMVADWRKDAKIETFDINGDPIEPAAGEPKSPESSGKK
ncbi:MAG TPA: peptidylprolyl isomerase [Alphaproteobacteria bacterium]|nr:peptidylprolyl isomerase [Alphaproteobacteria bacterium]